MQTAIWTEILDQWANNFSLEPEMPIESQAKFISKKYKVEYHEVTHNIYNENTQTSEPEVETVPLIRFKDIVCKYRPHLHLGDYWLHVNIVDGSPHYMFYTKVELDVDDVQLYHAQHPHLSGGKPCLGNFQGDMFNAISSGQFIQFMSIIKSYLQAYNGRSTYVKGKEFKKIPWCYQLHSKTEISEIFSDEGNSIDVYSVAKDPMRWNWPKNMTAFGDIEMVGQQNRTIFDYWKKVKYPYLENINSYRYNFDRFENMHTNKILGYVAIAIKVGELSILQAFEFVRIFLLTLKNHYNGTMNPDVEVKLKKLAKDIYRQRYGTFILNSRYTVSLNSAEEAEMADMQKLLRPYRETRSEESLNTFLKSLKFAGMKLTNFMILLRKRRPDKAKADTYLSNTMDTIDIPEVEKKYNRIKKLAYTTALQQLEKDKRSFIREINRPEVSNIIDNDGQGTLFSENL